MLGNTTSHRLNSPALEGSGICYSYAKSGWQLKNIDIALSRGEILALTGPNGSGKTTMIKLLATIKKASSGKLRIMGLDLVKNLSRIRSQISYVPQKSALVDLLSSQANLFLAASFHGHSPQKARRHVAELIDIFALNSVKDRQVGELSGGQYRRIALAMAFIGEPKLLLLDEPTVGMDAVSRNGFHVFLRELVRGGEMAVVLASHDEMEVAQLADKSLVFDNGESSEAVTPFEVGCRDQQSLVVRFLRTVTPEALDHFARFAPQAIQIDERTIEFQLNANLSLNSFLTSLAAGSAITGISSDLAPKRETALAKRRVQWNN